MDAPFPDTMMPAIAEFFQSEATREPGRDLYEDVFRSDGFFPLQRQAELVKMIQAARAIAPETVMEIGADKGGGFYHWVKCLPTVQRAICNEIRGTPYEDLFRAHFRNIEMAFIPASSRDPKMADFLPRFLRGKPLDVLFIDGDKSAFYEDFQYFLPHMRKGGLVFMHDIQDAPCRAGFEKSRKGRESYEIIDISDAKAAMAREAAGEPVACSHEWWLRHWKGRSCGVGVITI